MREGERPVPAAPARPRVTILPGTFPGVASPGGGGRGTWGHGHATSLDRVPCARDSTRGLTSCLTSLPGPPRGPRGDGGAGPAVPGARRGLAHVQLGAGPGGPRRRAVPPVPGDPEVRAAAGAGLRGAGGGVVPGPRPHRPHPHPPTPPCAAAGSRRGSVPATTRTSAGPTCGATSETCPGSPMTSTASWSMAAAGRPGCSARTSSRT